MPKDSRQLDFLGALSVVVGSILGTGIFLAPGVISSFSSSPWIALALWLAGGLVCAIGAAIYGRLGLMFPQGGGQYVYLRESLGPRFSRLYAWMSILVICPTMLAGSALYFAEQWKILIPLSSFGVKLVAGGTVMIFTLFNTQGISVAGSLQKGMVALHMALFIAVLGLAAILLPGGNLLPGIAHPPNLSGLSLSKGIFALAVVLWAFEGFNSVTFITNEIRDGSRNVRAIGLLGCAVVFALYLAFNLVTLNSIPASGLTQEPNAALALMSLLAGLKGGVVVFVLTVLGIATVLHSSLIIGPRIIRATAKDGYFFPGLARLDRRTHSPNRALWFQCLAVLAFLCIGRFESLITAFIVLNWIFYGLTVTGYLKLRWSRYLQGGGKEPGIVPETAVAALFLAMVALLLLSQFLSNPKLSALGLGAFLIGAYGADLATELVKRLWPESAPVAHSP